MPVSAGSLNRRIQFLRRTAGAYAALGEVQWGCLAFERATTVTVAGVPFQGRGGRLTVRGCVLTEGLKVGDHAVLDGDVFSIIIRKARAVDADDVDLEIESAPTPGLYASEVDRRGEIVSLRRRKATGSPPAYDAQVDVRAIVTGYAPSELVGGIMQGDSRVILLAADVAGGAFPLPIQLGGLDTVLINGRQRTFRMVDDLTHRVAGELLAYDCTVRG